ncbi:MAG TPA: hypothetical protein VM912_16965 [Terriglobales bacterium]|nr:hypothetical protein [Terriglobales bacterium]
MSIVFRRTRIFSCLLLLLTSLLYAQKSSKISKKKTSSEPPNAVTSAPAPPGDQAKNPEEDPVFKGLTWRLVGPFRGGRVLAVSGVVGEPNTYYFGGVGGGVWKTTDGGITWIPVSDKEKFSSIGAIAVAESDPNVVYVGTGEACIRNNILQGNGVFKSTDAGKTWHFIGLEDTRHIGRLAVHPKNPDIVFVAALGHAYGRNAERGVFRSTDGGKTWQKVLYKDDQTGAIDVVFDPSNPSILYAALWQAYRTPYSMVSGGPGSGLYRSADGGTTWTQIKGNGFPSGVLGRIGVAVSAEPNRIYALIEADKGGLYRSDDGGEHWRLVNDDHRFRQRAWYYTHVFADPKNADVVYVLNTGSYRSIDAGKTFTQLSTPHGDNHGLWIDPTNPKRLINSNDGGADISTDGGLHWTSQDNQPTAQFYHVIVDNQFPYHIYGAQQDNTSVGIASATNHSGIDRTDWNPVGGCESGYIAPWPKDPNIVYAGCYDGSITEFNKQLGNEREMNAWPLNPMGHGDVDLKYRFQWTAPIVISPHDPNVIYHGAQKVLKTSDRGYHWQEISGDLTRNDKRTEQSSGGQITQDNTSAEYYATVFTIAESALQAGAIWAGSDDGLVHVTTDGGKNWADVTPKDLPDGSTGPILHYSRISLIETGHFNAGTAYVAVDRHESDDWNAYAFKTTDFGKSWKPVNGDLPAGAVVRALREDPKREGLLYAATEIGVYVSFDDGAHWRSLQRNLPMSSMRDLAVTDRDLVVATHGRAFWVLDDITPLREYQPSQANADVTLYKPSTAYRFFGGGFGGGGGGRAAAIGQNPPNGAVIYYSLKTALNPTRPGESGEGEGQTGAGAQQPSTSTQEAAAAKQPGTPQTNAPTGAKVEAQKQEATRQLPAEEPKEEHVTVEILDASGKVIRTYPPKQPTVTESQNEEAGEAFMRQVQPNPTGNAGLNRFVWNLRYEDSTKVPGAILWGGSNNGPVAVPGSYQVRLTVRGKSYTQPVEIKEDPRLKVDQADLQKQFDLLLQIRDEVSKVDEAINQMNSVKRQIDDLDKRLPKDDHGKAVRDAAKDLTQKIDPIQDALIQSKAKSSQDVLNFPIRLNNELVALAGSISTADAAPTDQSYQVFSMLKQRSDEQVAKWEEMVKTDLANFNQLVRQQEVPAIILDSSGSSATGAAPSGGFEESREEK